VSSTARILGELARDWRVKVAIQNVLAVLPGTLGFKANEACVRLLRGYVDKTDTNRRIEKGISNLALIQRETGVSFVDVSVLEVGTGWHGIDLVLFSLVGAKHIYTVDHHQHLTLQSIQSHTPAILSPQSLERLSELAPGVTERAAALDWKKWGTLPEALRQLNVTALVSRSCLTNRLDIPSASIDVFYSDSVLHRIPEGDLALLLQDVGQRLLRSGGVCFHRTDQCDINSQSHIDQSLWRLAYLKYPDWFFDRIISGRFNSQNRLRESDFIKLLESSEVRVIFKESVMHKEDLERMETFRVAKRFRGKSLEDLATVRSTLVGRKDAGHRPGAPP
jgi:hypothetical protein